MRAGSTSSGHTIGGGDAGRDQPPAGEGGQRPAQHAAGLEAQSPGWWRRRDRAEQQRCPRAAPGRRSCAQAAKPSRSRPAALATMSAADPVDARPSAAPAAAPGPCASGEAAATPPAAQQRRSPRPGWPPPAARSAPGSRSWPPAASPGGGAPDSRRPRGSRGARIAGDRHPLTPEARCPPRSSAGRRGTGRAIGMVAMTTTAIRGGQSLAKPPAVRKK